VGVACIGPEALDISIILSIAGEIVRKSLNDSVESE